MFCQRVLDAELEEFKREKQVYEPGDSENLDMFRKSSVAHMSTKRNIIGSKGGYRCYEISGGPASFVSHTYAWRLEIARQQHERHVYRRR